MAVVVVVTPVIRFISLPPAIQEACQTELVISQQNLAIGAFR
jgi:hypothetical protein